MTVTATMIRPEIINNRGKTSNLEKPGGEYVRGSLRRRRRRTAKHSIAITSEITPMAPMTIWPTHKSLNVGMAAWSGALGS